MTDPMWLPVSRRTLIRAGAWAAPVIASAVAVPARTTSPPVEVAAVAVATTIDGYPALAVESTEAGVPLPSGQYFFTATGGVAPTAGVFVVSPDLGAYTSPAPPGATTAMVILPEDHPVTSFTAYIITSALPDGIDPDASLTVSLPLGIGATVALLPDGVGGPEAATYGPTGMHWPARTPRVDDTFDAVVEVPPTWEAIDAAIRQLHASHPDGKAKIVVQPGQLPLGAGARSSANGVLQGIGGAGRAWRILVVPRDGWGTVTGSGSVFAYESEGYSFRGVNGVALVGFDFTQQGVVVRSCDDFALAWSTFGVLNVTANEYPTSGVELIECVLPDQLDLDGDRMAFRVANGYSIEGIEMRGCYVAPSYRAASSSVHTDTLQTSATGGGFIRNLTFADSVFFHSSSQTLQFEYAENVSFTGTALIGGLRGAGRYPFGGDRFVPTAENTLWGGRAEQPHAANNVLLDRTIVMGAISEYWQIVQATAVTLSRPTGAMPAEADVRVDEQFATRDQALDPEWLEQHCPLPTPSRLSAVWSALVA
ncbi:hypothetical protein [Microbacterium aurantiacum]|uniref:Uncharacterized protein n=1 Tax=Microbacterium aurantiacum TaxID=162393 RepID=A0AAJ2LZ76_9MICO|nr:hypothetical protein [Microbacterium aurantiacum]MDS0244196.1 hypothetical protein [Microbacterium aurantiacum]